MKDDLDPLTNLRRNPANRPLLGLTLLVATMTLSTGRTTMVQGGTLGDLRDLPVHHAGALTGRGTVPLVWNAPLPPTIVVIPAKAGIPLLLAGVASRKRGPRLRGGDEQFQYIPISSGKARPAARRTALSACGDGS